MGLWNRSILVITVPMGKRTHRNSVFVAYFGDLRDFFRGFWVRDCDRQLVNVDRGPFGIPMQQKILVVGADSVVPEQISQFADCLKGTSEHRNVRQGTWHYLLHITLVRKAWLKRPQPWQLKARFVVVQTVHVRKRARQRSEEQHTTPRPERLWYAVRLARLLGCRRLRPQNTPLEEGQGKLPHSRNRTAEHGGGTQC